jgi:hypothetical protein
LAGDGAFNLVVVVGRHVQVTEDELRHVHVRVHGVAADRDAHAVVLHRKIGFANRNLDERQRRVARRRVHRVGHHLVVQLEHGGHERHVLAYHGQ